MLDLGEVGFVESPKTRNRPRVIATKPSVPAGQSSPILFVLSFFRAFVAPPQSRRQILSTSFLFNAGWEGRNEVACALWGRVERSAIRM